MARRVALYTFGVFRAPAGHPVNQGFHDRNDINLLAAERSEGFISRSGYDDEPGPESWGKQVFPRFYVERGDGWSPSTLSLWKDLESPIAFTYAGIHAEALKLGRGWFQKPAWPPYALWWVEGDYVPTWSDAVVRHEHLHEHKASSFAFDFKTPFDGDGHPAGIDRGLVKRLVSSNMKRQQPELDPPGSIGGGRAP
jgi:hypothetical protein